MSLQEEAGNNLWVRKNKSTAMRKKRFAKCNISFDSILNATKPYFNIRDDLKVKMINKMWVRKVKGRYSHGRQSCIADNKKLRN